jgi:UrcA family protein
MNSSFALRRCHALKSTILAAAVAAIFGLAAGAMAGEQPVYRSMHVSLGDLDLSTPEGVSMARERVHQAARLLCSKLSDKDDLSRQPNYVACINDAVARVTPQILEFARLRSPVSLAGNRPK